MLHLRLAVALMLAVFGAEAATEAPVHIAILAFRPAAEVQSRWQPLIDYLNGKIPGYRFQVEAMGYRRLEAAIAKRTVDFVLTNPSHYILMTYRNGLSSPLATLVPAEAGRSLPRFGGVIITLADRKDIGLADDLRDRTIAAVTRGSLGGFQAQAMELERSGLRIRRDIELLQTGMPHDRVVAAVLEGHADAGFVRTGVLEQMAGEGRLELARIKVIAPKKAPGFPLLLSTSLYPEWPFAAMPGVDGDLARQVAAALLSLPHGNGLTGRLDIHGFTIPKDYELVRTTLEALRLPPFDTAPRFTPEDIWNKYRWETAAGLVLVSVIALLTIWLLFLNRQLREGRRRIQHAAQEWHRLLTALGEGVYGVDADGRCTFINPAALAMLGFSADELLGRDQHALFHQRHEDGTDYPANECPITLTLNDGVARNWQDWFWRKDGSGFPVMLTTTPMGDADSQDGTVVIFRDISEQQQKENRLRKEATTDHLTGAANRRLFMDQLHMEFDRFKRFGESAAVIMADIDHFKKINDTYGHAAGDEVLRHFTGLSRQSLRSTDLLGRLGGEEFGIMLPVTDMEEAREFAERYRRLVDDTPAPTHRGDISCTVSLGIAEFDLRDDTPEQVLARADAGLYRAKEAGRNTVAVAVRGEAARITRSWGRSFIHLRWKAGYACGEQTIDAEHRELFRLANTVLDRVVRPETSLEEIRRSFGMLISHVAKHFKHEEAILRARGYPQADEHAALHRQLVDRATRLNAQVDRKDSLLGELTNFLVSEVVAGHLLNEDKKFYGLFKNGRL